VGDREAVPQSAVFDPDGTLVCITLYKRAAEEVCAGWLLDACLA
jgi:hypothetical protein